MEILTTNNQVNEALGIVRAQQKKIAFVPTMGFLHDGHLSLVRKAKEVADIVIVSIFVNKEQFNEHNDFLEYPRDVDNDSHKLLQEEVDFLFVPNDEEIYPSDDLVNEIGADKELSSVMCGKYRAGHFDGVCKVLHRLFTIIDPDFAVFGLKDFQQFAVVKKMISDLRLDIEMVGVQTVRMDDSIALSSRNARLSDRQLMVAQEIFREIKILINEVKNTSNINLFLQNSSKKFEKEFGVVFDYLELRSEIDLRLIEEPKDSSRLFWAYKVGSIRLIDNVKI